MMCLHLRFQGGGKRKGSFAIYLEPWHADIHAWLDLRKNHGTEHERARDLFYALWIPDLFMKVLDPYLPMVHALWIPDLFMHEGTRPLPTQVLAYFGGRYSKPLVPPLGVGAQ